MCPILCLPLAKGGTATSHCLSAEGRHLCSRGRKPAVTVRSNPEPASAGDTVPIDAVSMCRKPLHRSSPSSTRSNAERPCPERVLQAPNVASDGNQVGRPAPTHHWPRVLDAATTSRREPRALDPASPSMIHDPRKSAAAFCPEFLRALRASVVNAFLHRRLQPRRKLLPHLLHLRRHRKHAIRLHRIVRVIILVVILGRHKTSAPAPPPSQSACRSTFSRVNSAITSSAVFFCASSR